MEKDWCVLKIDESRMWATLSIKQPEGEEQIHFSPEYIESYLKDNGITSGLNTEAIQALSNYVEYDREVEVARGKEPINGLDGVYNYTVMMEDAHSKPVINPDGTVDYHNSLKLAMIKQDELFAVYEPATNGEYGYTIFSEMLPPVKGKDLRPLRGRGFYTDENQREYRASVDGRLVRDGDRVTVEKVYYVRGDLDIEQGNIKFNGDVEIKGDVRSGLVIDTDGDIFVHGHVGACVLKAGKDISIKKGVQGRNKCCIEAGGNVVCSFVERCDIKAGKNIYADSILDSTVEAYGEVIVNSKKGIIVGGHIVGMQGISVREAGNSSNVVTDLVFGVLKRPLERSLTLAEDIKRITAEIGALDKHLKVYEALEGDRRTKETEAVRMKILRAKVIKNTDLKKLREEKEKLDEAIGNARDNAKLRVTGVAHAGIRVTCGQNTVSQREDWKDISYMLRNYKLKLLPGDDADSEIEPESE